MSEIYWALLFLALTRPTYSYNHMEPDEPNLNLKFEPNLNLKPTGGQEWLTSDEAGTQGRNPAQEATSSARVTVTHPLLIPLSVAAADSAGTLSPQGENLQPLHLLLQDKSGRGAAGLNLTSP